MSRSIFFGALFVTMLSFTICRRKRYDQTLVRSIIAGLLIWFSGISGAFLMGIIESGYVGNTSYYGAVFFVPVIMALFALPVRCPLGKMLDYTAPCVCAAVTVGKVFCNIFGCCGGRILWYAEPGVPVRFPSQIVEAVVALAITVYLLRMEKKHRYENYLYPVFMIAYGATRFILHWFRETRPFIWFLPAGNFWSLISVSIGVIIVIGKKRSIKNDKE